MLKRASFPAIIIALFVIITFGVVTIAHVLSNKSLVFLNYMNAYGLDYIDFYRASQRIIGGQSPYDISENRYVTTPIPAIINIAFIPLGFDKARILLYFLIPLSLMAGYKLLTSTFEFTKTDTELILLAGLFTLLFSYPGYFLFQRENIDGWVFLFLCLGMYSFEKSKKELSSGLFFSLAIAFKIYPILIMLPMVLSKKWRLLFWVGLWLALWGLITLFWFSDFRATLSMRSQSFFRFDENGSLVATVSLITIFINSLGMSTIDFPIKFSPIIAALIYGPLLSVLILSDYKLGRLNKLAVSSWALYLPFMVALPQVVYHYSFILCLILIPSICDLWEISTDKKQRITIFIISIGIALTQFQAIAIYNLTQNPLSHAIPGLGLMIIMTGIIAYKITTLRILTTPVLQTQK